MAHAIIIWLHNYSNKEKILKSSWSKGVLFSTDPWFISSLILTQTATRSLYSGEEVFKLKKGSHRAWLACGTLEAADSWQWAQQHVALVVTDAKT